MSEPAPSALTFSEIAAALARVYVLKLGLDLLGLVLGQFRFVQLSGGLWLLAAYAVYFALLILLWRGAPWIGRLVTRGSSAPITTANFALVDIYSFAFLLMGLWFAVDSLGPALTWLQRSMSGSVSDVPLSNEQKANFYSLFNYLVQLGLGLTFIFAGRNFAIRLVRRQTTQV